MSLCLLCMNVPNVSLQTVVQSFNTFPFRNHESYDEPRCTLFRLSCGGYEVQNLKWTAGKPHAKCSGPNYAFIGLLYANWEGFIRSGLWISTFERFEPGEQGRQSWIQCKNANFCLTQAFYHSIRIMFTVHCSQHVLLGFDYRSTGALGKTRTTPEDWSYVSSAELNELSTGCCRTRNTRSWPKFVFNS